MWHFQVLGGGRARAVRAWAAQWMSVAHQVLAALLVLAEPRAPAESREPAAPDGSTLPAEPAEAVE
jgi:hypothetical protein